MQKGEKGREGEREGRRKEKLISIKRRYIAHDAPNFKREQVITEESGFLDQRIYGPIETVVGKNPSPLLPSPDLLIFIT
jgi:hypothetical protein